MKKLVIGLAMFAPLVAFAQEPIVTTQGLFNRLLQLGDMFTYLLIAIAVIYIIWNVVRYMIAGGEEDKKLALKNFTWGIVGLFLILSIWGIVNILVNTFPTRRDSPLTPPLTRPF